MNLLVGQHLIGGRTVEIDVRQVLLRVPIVLHDDVVAVLGEVRVGEAIGLAGAILIHRTLHPTILMVVVMQHHLRRQGSGEIDMGSTLDT